MNKRKILMILYSFMATIGISTLIDTFTIDGRESANNVFMIIIFFAFYFFIKNINVKVDKRKLIFSSIFSIILSAIIIVGSQLELNHTSISKVQMIFGFIFISITLIPIVMSLLSIEIKEKKQVTKRNMFFKIFLVIWIFGIIAWLSLYPGGYDYDAPVQLRQFMNPAYKVNTHFSVLFSYLEYLIVSLGYKIFGNYQAAIGLFTFLQMTIVSLVTSYSSYFIYKESRNNKVLLLISVTFFSLFPFHLLLQISCVQDTLFASSILIFAISIYKFINRTSNNKFDALSLIISGILATLFRNNGIYIIIFLLIISILICFIFKIKINKKIYFTNLIVIISFYYIYASLILPALGVIKGDSIREMSSIPSQQLASVYNYNKNTFSNKELKLLNEFYPNCDFSIYTINQLISDNQKSCLNEKYTKTHIKKYAELYISIGKKDLKNYTKAFLLNTYGFWYPNKSYPDYRMFHPYIEYKISTPSIFSSDFIEIKRNSKISIIEKYFKEVLNENKWQKIPVISSICSMGNYFVFVLFLIVLILYRKKYKYLIPISIYVGIYITLFLSPVALYRYVYSIVISIPLLTLILYKTYLKNQN